VAASPEFGVLIPQWFFANQCGRVVLLGLLESGGFSGSGKKGVTLGSDSLLELSETIPKSGMNRSQPATEHQINHLR
jgi:hypothetical protein